MQNLHLLEYSVEAFQCWVFIINIWQSWIELSYIGIDFQFIEVGIAEILVWLACVIVSKSV